MLQTSVEMVKPGGTGSPALVISASPEPLPPSRSFMFRLPSALPDPKKYTCFLPVGFLPVGFFPVGFVPVAFFDIRALDQAGNWIVALSPRRTPKTQRRGPISSQLTFRVLPAHRV